MIILDASVVVDLLIKLPTEIAHLEARLAPSESLVFRTFSTSR